MKFFLVNPSSALDTNSLSGTIPSSIKNLKSLTKFHIRGNFFTGLSPEITSLPISDCGLYNNPYSCLPSVPSSCVHPSLSTASKCLEPTNDDSSGRIGAVKTSEFAAILGSVFAIILLFTAGLFVFRRRKLSATPKAGKSTVKSQNDGNDTSTDTTKIRDGAAALKMDPSLSTLNLPSNFRYPSLSAAHSAPPSPYYYSNSYTTLNSSMPSNFDLCDATSPNAYSQAHSNNAMNTDAVEHLHQREFDSEYGTLYLSSHPHAGNGLESIHGRENKGEEVLFIAQEVIRP
ncbi:hypothetical protein BKA69DRAFT_863110 [Paraphysoderma sedebokerense]|nr:hypothetical protein BKA69DRAFT_863110 [Paraphysoderma sedebokerense]